MAYMAEPGKILRRALEIKAMMKAGITITRDELNAAELLALMVVEEEIAAWEKEREPKQ